MATIYHRPELAASLAKSLIHPSVLEEGMRSGLFLSGLRRVGKTTFVRMDLIPALEAAGALVIYVDLWTDTTANPALLTQAAIRSTLAELQTPKSAVLKQLKRARGIDVRAEGFKFDFALDSVGVRGGTTLAQALTAVVDQAKTDLVFIVDEVQQAITPEDGNAMLLALKATRDAINQRPDTPGYFLFIGTGSHQTLVSELTARRDQAFAGAVFRPFPVLGRDYVKDLLARMRADGAKPLPSLDATVNAFEVFGHRPEELKKALESLGTSFPAGGDVDQIFGVVVQTLRNAAADLDIYVLEKMGTLAEAVFQRLGTEP